MYVTEAREEYALALRQGQRSYKQAMAEGRDPYPAVLDEILGSVNAETAQLIGTVEIPVDRIVGVRSAGRISAFSADFMPLLPIDSEFGSKWITLCQAHLSSGIRDPIECIEYLGRFYVQEGNKRVSVLRHLGATRIPANVRRILPEPSEEPEIRAYYEFLDFYRDTGLYRILFRRPGDYTTLRSLLGKEAGERWTQRETRTLSSYFGYFQEAFSAVNGESLGLLPEEGLLLWLQVHPFRELGELPAGELKKSLSALWPELAAHALPEPVEVRTEPVDADARPGVLNRIISGISGPLNVAFVHPSDPASSPWVKGHDAGRRHLEEVLAGQVAVRSYFHADSPQETEALLEQAVAEGADVVFTTTPQLSRATLRIAVKYPKVRFLNCSVDTPYPSIRTYYCRIFEAKFITGAIAGAMAENDVIGYIGSSPILGVPASINAFALGAQLTNPRAKIVLRWSCQAGSPQADLMRDGIRVISNRDVPVQDRMYLNFCNYGTYAMDDRGNLQALASPVWLWGRLYEKVVRSVLAGTYGRDGDTPRAVNYWWGMDSGAIDVELSDQLPEGLRCMAAALRAGLRDGTVDPFLRRITAQDGTLVSDGQRSLTADEILRMDWLCENVYGSIPEYGDIQPYAQPIVRQLGIHRDRIPPEKEGAI